MNTTEITLEYDKVLEMLAERAVGELAREACRKLEPSVDQSSLKRMRTETDDAVSVCLRKGTPPFSNIPDNKGILSYAEKGGSLTPGQLKSVAWALGSAKSIRKFLTSDIPEDVAYIRGLADTLVPLEGLERRITDAIVSDTELADGASAELRRLRRAIERQNEKIRGSLARFITGRDYEDILMDKVITMRNGRFVLPVKQEQAARFQGIVHDRSKGGATVFIEPQIIVDMNNGLRELELEEQAEIDRILAEISAEAGMSAEVIRENQEGLVRLDFIFAKANLSLDMKACPVSLSADRMIDIENARNPLIAAGDVVPVSIRFGEEDRLLVITGPNTGGKTVTLKTIGLFLLMAHSGLHVPASRASLPLADCVFADIGDEQSIEQSLSTFSSHMKRIVEILKSASADSVVLLDELGAGTDPMEGAALAIAILETLRARGCLVMATTHYTELKKYAIGTEGVGNASMEFDLATLSPAYRLNMGNPGRSNAFEIASRLGIDKEIVARARDLLDAETLYFDDVMEQIELDRADAAKYLAEAKLSEKEALILLADADSKSEKIERDRDSILTKAKEQAENLLAEVSEEADAVREELKELIREARSRGVADGASNIPAGRPAEAKDAAAGPVDAGDALRRADESRKRLRENANAAKTKKASAGRKKENRLSLPSLASPLAPGDIVALSGSNTTGEVLTMPDERGRVMVRAGSVKLSLPADELVKQDAESKKAGSSGHRYAKIVVSKMGATKPSIDLHGKNLDEAEMMVEKYLDDAILARMHEVVICHGRGSGVLRSGIRKMLKKNKHVAGFRDGGFDEGGDGVTVVTLGN